MTHPRAIRGRIADGLTALPSGFVGSPASYRSLIAALVLVRRPFRQGPSEQQLVNAADDVAYADSGAPDYEYTTLEVEDWVASGDPVGAAVLFDQVSGAPVPGATTVGRPATTRDGGVGPCTSTDYIEIASPLPATAFTIAHWFDRPADTSFTSCGMNGVGSSTLTGLTHYTTGGSVAAVFRVNSSVRNNMSINYTASPATRFCSLITYDGAGNATFRLYTEAGVLHGTPEATSGTATPTDGVHRFGGKVSVIDVHEGTDLRYAVYSGVLSEAAQDAIADGSDLTGGGTYLSGSDGMRSGVLDPSDASILVVGDDVGLSVLAP